jgi:ubiquinone/menaquinone biosynthesis C-methylase UbiE
VDRVTVHGVGAGRELSGIRSVVHPARILAFDLSQPMVDACRRHIERHGWDDVTAERAAIDDAPVPDGSVDLVIALGAVLGYGRTTTERAAMVADLRRQCRQGAGLAVVVQQRYGRPDWSVYFTVSSLLTALSLRSVGSGNRVSRHGDAGTVFHHYSASELTGLLRDEGFDDVRAEPLRQWARRNGQRVPLRSPNPLLVTATAR